MTHASIINFIEKMSSLINLLAFIVFNDSCGS